MEDKIPQMKQVIIGVNRELYNKLEFGKKNLSAETIIFVYADKTAEIIDASQFEEDKKLQIMENLNKVINNSIENPKNYKTLYSDDKNFEKIYAKAVKQIEKQENPDKKDSNFAKIATIAGIGTLATAGIIAGAYMLGKNSNENKEDVNQEQDLNNSQLVPDMIGKDIAFYSENALETNQKALMLNINNFVSQNGKESWSKVTFTDEELDNLRKLYPNLSIEGNEAIFGFTAEDMYSLALRFGHYSKDEYVTLNGGKEIDTVAVMDDTHSMSNGALASIISYYICSDECDLNIEQAINFNEKEVAKIKEIEKMLAEYKKLDKEDGKEKEAEAKMKEIKSWINDYAYSVDFEQDNAKSYILRTFLPACSAISEMHQYKDKTILNLYDTKNDKNVDKEVKMPLFDELMMRNLVLGFNETDGMGAFDAETFLEENNISKSRYNLVNTDVARSIADQSVSGQLERLNQANEYIASLRSEDVTAEAAYRGSLKVDFDSEKSTVDQVIEQMDNVNTTYDNLTYGSYDYEILLEMINNNLKENNIYPKNINYFKTAKMSEMAIEYKNNHGITKGKKGDYIKVEEVQHNVEVTEAEIMAPNAIVVDENGQEIPKEQALAEAREEDAKTSTEYDFAASTPEENQKAEEQASQNAAERAQMLQNVYNATFNYFASENVANTSVSYDSSWEKSSDSDIVYNYNLAKEDGLKYKADKALNGTIIVEEPTESIPEDAEIYETPQAPVESVNNTTNDNNVIDDSNNNDINDNNIGDNSNSDEGFSDVAPEGFAPVVDDTEKDVSYEESVKVDNSFSPVVTEDYISTGDEIIIPEDAEIYETPQAPVESVDNTVPDEGFSDVAPEGFAPVLDENSISLYSLNSISDEEWEQLIIPVEETDDYSDELTGLTK